MKLNRVNEFKLILPAIHDNVSIAINTLDRFLCVNNIVAEQASEIKLVITEALDNVAYHAYAGNNYENNNMILDAHIETNNKLVIKVADKGVGIADIVQAREPLFSTGNPDQHSGMGFTIMEQYSDSVVIKSKVGFGTKIRFVFYI